MEIVYLICFKIFFYNQRLTDKFFYYLEHFNNLMQYVTSMLVLAMFPLPFNKQSSYLFNESELCGVKRHLMKFEIKN